VIVRVPGIFAGGDQGEVTRTIGAVLLEDVLGIGLQLILLHAGAGIAHGLDDAESGDARGFANDGDFARALDAAQLIENGIEVFDFGLRRGGFEMFDEGLLARGASVPGVAPGGAGERGGIAGGRAAQHFGAVGSIDGAALFGDGLERRLKLVALQDGLDAGGAHRILARGEAGSEHHGLAALVARIQEERGGVRFAIEQEDGARLDNSRDVEELVGLAKRLLAGTFGGALNDSDAVAEFGHDACTAGGIFVGREHVSEDGLRGNGQGKEEDREIAHVSFSDAA
jgi:hypothetical protein